MDEITCQVLEHMPYNSVLWEFYSTCVTLRMLKPRIVGPKPVYLSRYREKFSLDYVYNDKFITIHEKRFVL